ncbi:hypothetical protein SARC_02293 [Sphaeroforma arctica JP610]|uniref:Uncharacterized protein n=1 Tax=Sphaeroforma arctica JP610 TaxID=667725 RepID=A0A0L0G928_9EUKA|nr:hypothetical protein SARC_02293 [Sphaeroforma arctica JP610]KNC85532.1 hypothetical protein SARC_02293 [Sphaeroforma arctica JP610]|eukprot:XP_014159434.1 hypothetical protein SARC_02293 [Sphaeroforma arctica JP610]
MYKYKGAFNIHEFILGHGDLYVMYTRLRENKTFQQVAKHRVPASLKSKGWRINLSFRVVADNNTWTHHIERAELAKVLDIAIIPSTSAHRVALIRDSTLGMWSSVVRTALFATAVPDHTVMFGKRYTNNGRCVVDWFDAIKGVKCTPIPEAIVGLVTCVEEILGADRSQILVHGVFSSSATTVVVPSVVGGTNTTTTSEDDGTATNTTTTTGEDTPTNTDTDCSLVLSSDTSEASVKAAVERAGMRIEDYKQTHDFDHYASVLDSQLNEQVMEFTLRTNDSNGAGDSQKPRNELTGPPDGPSATSLKVNDHTIQYTFALKIVPPMDTEDSSLHLYQVFNNGPIAVLTVNKNMVAQFHSPGGVFDNIDLFKVKEHFDKWYMYMITARFSKTAPSLEFSVKSLGHSGADPLAAVKPPLKKDMAIASGSYLKPKVGLYFVRDTGPKETFTTRVSRFRCRLLD